MKTIAFIQTSALGDCILSTAVLRALRQREPDARITWLIFDQYREVAAHNPDCDDYLGWPLDPSRTRQEQEHEVWPVMLTYAGRNFDEVVCPQVYPWRDWRKHEGMHLLDQMFDKAGVERPDDARLVFESSYKDNDPLYGWPMKWQCRCNTQSNTQKPLWSSEKWCELGCLMRRDNTMSLSSAESVKCGGSLASWHFAIGGSGLYIGLDSGGSWLAATTDTPQIVLYSSQSTCPHWLTSVKGAGVKDPALIHEMFDPTPEQVARKVKEIVG